MCRPFWACSTGLCLNSVPRCHSFVDLSFPSLTANEESLVPTGYHMVARYDSFHVDPAESSPEHGETLHVLHGGWPNVVGVYPLESFPVRLRSGKRKSIVPLVRSGRDDSHSFMVSIQWCPQPQKGGRPSIPNGFAPHGCPLSLVFVCQQRPRSVPRSMLVP